MKYIKEELAPFLTQYTLEGKENKFSRLAMYNKLLFFNLGFLSNKKAKTIIIINEIKTGGILITNEKFADKVIANFSKNNKEYLINFNKQAISKGLHNKLVYYSFCMSKK